MHHPELPMFLLLVDWDGSEPLEVEGATLIPGRKIGGWHFDYMALKYSAQDLCCALKPYLLDHLIENLGVRKVLYLDCDIYVFAPLDAMLERLDAHDFVVTPHTLAPMPHLERFWERPTLGDLAYAGVLNAGMFGIRASSGARSFLAVWQGLVTGPGAFLPDLGAQMEQNSFNWITCFADDVHVLRDPAYNVAYWNLHDRSLRYRGLDDGQADGTWTVDGEPLVAFHFSGFSPAFPFTVSKHDRRYSPYLMPSFARLLDFYHRILCRHGAAEAHYREYGFEAFPSGIRIDTRMRHVFKVHESFLWSDLSPWTPAGEAHYCEALLSPVPYTGSLMPILFSHIYDDRPDLQQAFPDARLQPDGFLRWIYGHGTYECGYEDLLGRFRPALPTHHGAVVLTAVHRQAPRIFEGLESPLGADRERLIERLEETGLVSVAAQVRSGELEHYFVSSIRLIRRIVDERVDVRRAFPDLLFSDAADFVQWLETHGACDHFLPAHAPAVFAAKAKGRSLARIFSYLNRNWHFMERWPLALVGEGSEELAVSLLTVLRHGIEYDVDDILMYLWVMDVKPWAGLALTFELAYNARGHPSPLLAEGQEHLLKPLLKREPRFHQALAAYRREHCGRGHRITEDYVRHFGGTDRSAAISVYSAIERAPLAPRRLKAGPAAPSRRFMPPFRPVPGVNLFGFHKSPIGLGHLTRGLSRALESTGLPVRPNVLGNIAMDADLCPGDFVRSYDHRLDTNLFVSYPHLHDLLLEALPEHVIQGRRNVVYLAWEQRDGSHYWPEVYAGFQQVWALSEFAAECFRRFMQREVVTVPCVLDTSAFPPAAAKEEVGLNPCRFTFLYIFDANSSIERKNPEAVVHAFAQSFSPDDDVQLVLRVSNAGSPDHRERLKRLLRAAPRSLDIKLVLDEMSHCDLLRLLSAADCYVSLHRAEGFGYTCAEAMAYGRPVIATGYSGNLQFMSCENSYLVDYEEREVATADGPFQRGSIWAEPSVEHAAYWMRTVYRDRDAAAEVAARGRCDVLRQLSVAAVARIAADALGLPMPPDQAIRGSATAAIQPALQRHPLHS